MSADKSWDRGAALSLSAARIQRGMQGRDTEENRAAVPTLVCGHLELTICEIPYLLYPCRWPNLTGQMWLAAATPPYVLCH
ncbi:hypothetical protein Y032_0272g941 [Ancylostoma ceylanicum]|uniref:Uncharacterized protein n=1 Tax=Ancylostoma ceylanicum TaxID=53326 RepID=A0A016S877_9BILA|nr:hypothetical protein Y032_0272g941 [Ancylostoma ceylanicum]